MDPLGNPITTRPIQPGWELSIEPYPCGWLGFTEEPDRQFGNGSVLPQTRIWSDGLEPLLTLHFVKYHWQRQSIGETYQSISSAAWVWLPAFTATLLRHSATLLALSIEHDTKFVTNHQRKPRISTLWPTVARIYLHKGVYSGSEMFPPSQIAEQGPSPPGPQRVPPGQPQNHPVNQPTSSRSNPPPEPPSGTPRRPPIGHSIKQFQPPSELQKTNISRIADFPPLLEMAYHDYDGDDGSDNSSDLGGAEGKLPISLKQTEFPWKPFTKRMEQANYSGFNKWRKV